MKTSEILALASKPTHLWTLEEEHAATTLLHETPEPLPDAYVQLLYATGEAETERLLRQGATRADLDD